MTKVIGIFFNSIQFFFQCVKVLLAFLLAYFVVHVLRNFN